MTPINFRLKQYIMSKFDNIFSVNEADVEDYL